MERVILDTDFLSYLLIQNHKAVEKIALLIKEDMYPVTTSISKAEMFYGAYKVGWGDKRLHKLNKMFSSLNVLEFSEKTAEIYGENRAFLVNNGIDIGFADVAIASIALENNTAILTGNIKHFNRIPNIKLIEY